MAALLNATKLVDCSHLMDENTFTFMGAPLQTEILEFDLAAPAGFAKAKFNLGCDVGAHIDTPGHFFPNERTVGDITLEELTARGAVIDVTDKVAATEDGNYGLTVDDITNWESKYGEIPAGSLVVMKTGWDANIGTPKYVGQDEAGAYHFPGFSVEAAQWLIDNRDFAGLAVDSASADVGTSTDYMVHQIVLGADKYNLENLVLGEVPEGTDSLFIALPMKVKDAPETPVRVMAVVGMSFSGAAVFTAACASMVATMLAF